MSAVVGLAIGVAAMPAPSARADDQVAFLYGSPSANASVDLDTIKTRLRNTSAVGTFTKLRLSWALDSILDEIDRFHDGDETANLAEAKARFDRLLADAARQLRSGDPWLSKTLVRSREALWAALVGR